jgi:hypothetical protein
MALLANISFQDGPAGKTPVPTNQWFPTVQRRRYGSNRGKTMIQGTAATVAKKADAVTPLVTGEPAPSVHVVAV